MKKSFQKLLSFAGMLLIAACTTVTPPPPIATIENEPPAAVSQANVEPPLPPYTPGEPRVVTLASSSPLVTISVMVTQGSTADPVGKEGLANLTADSILDGGYMNGATKITKERLAEMTAPWGSGARPSTFTSSRTTTFYFTAPREVLNQYVRDVLRPMLNEPAFDAQEIDRLKNETVSAISSLRSEDLENLGLSVIDQYVLAGTPYEHHPIGTDAAVPALTRDDVVRFYRDFYRPENMIVGVSSDDPAVVAQVRDAVRSVNRNATTASPAVVIPRPAAFTGREAVIIQEPNAPAASVHLGFPYAVNRNHPDYWPLYVANVWLGTHRDSFGQLYGKIREERGYNYGDYSYIEYWGGRTYNLFQVFNQPREQQYFSLWLRPVKHEHAVHLAKAATYELEQMVQRGLTADDVTAAKNKAKILYLNLGETVPRLLAARVDDAFYGARQGFLNDYLTAIEAVTPEQVNAAIRRNLGTENIRYVIVTSTPHLAATQEQLRTDLPVYGKSWKDYEFSTAKLADGTTVWQVPEAKMPTVQLDAVWASHPLRIRRMTVIPASALFTSPTMLRMNN
ncbi:MAG TPA: pitrilysin family protein [Thermoanaerobaculia bacterium]|jgi:zinc protease